MANINKPNLGFNANRGRSELDRIAGELNFRAREVASSRPFFAFAALAAILLGTYYFLIATPVYVSEANFSIRGREQAPADGSLLASLGQTNNTSVETAEVTQYILSGEMLAKLDERFHLRQQYSQPRLDLLNYMSSHARREDFLNFYRRMVTVEADKDTNILTVKAHAFDAKSAQQLAEAIMEISADYVDGLSNLVRKDTLRASEQELQEAESAVRDARLKMASYRTTTGLLDPAANAAAATGSILSLQTQIDETRADIASLETFNTAKSPQVVQLQAKIAALQSQIADTQKRIANTSRSDNIARQLYEYEGLSVTNDYADKQLVAALAAYDASRSLASQRERFLVRVVNPNFPDRATLPHRMLSFLESLIVVVAAYGIVALAIAGVRDHQGI